jgi:glycosyltransferase involved in cell wall biosynthesis
MPYVVTVHDLAYLAEPSWFPALRSLYYRLAFTRTARGAELVMVDSRFTGREAVRLAGVPEESLRTVYLSADNGPASPGPLMERLGLSPGYLLCVGTVEPRKNLESLLDALELLRRRRSGLELLVAGRWGWGPPDLRQRLRSQPGVVWPGALGGDDLKRAYTGAALLVYPSVYEGFGLPPLEAARAGLASVVGPAGALAEVYRDAAFHSAADPASLAETVEAALESPPPKGMEALAARLTNARMARRVLDVYAEATP